MEYVIMACKPTPEGNRCADAQDTSCTPFQLSNNEEACFIQAVVEESLNIGGAIVHVFKLLGVHEQGLLLDLVGNGNSISGGDLPGFPSLNAFTSFASEWRSLQRGSAVTTSAYIGYDFGELKLDNNRVQYGVDAGIVHNIASLKIKQGPNPTNRVTRARVERSNDKNSWYGVSVISLPDNDSLNVVSFKHSVPSKFWRLRPIDFNGGTTDGWVVTAIQLFDYDETSIDDVQDFIFQENRDRDYASESITLKATYDLIDTQTELSRFGIELPSQMFYLQMSFNACVRKLGRPIIIGDIVELPSETQYNMKMEPIKKYLEITDVGWSTEGYTPGWQPTLVKVVAQPAFASQETQDIFGDLSSYRDNVDLNSMDDGNHPFFQDLSAISQSIEVESVVAVPERGTETENAIQKFSQEQIQSAANQGAVGLGKLGANSTGLYAEDGLPPNGAPFTEGDTLPTISSNGNYHRLTYSGLSHNVPPRLFRFSSAKNRWIYMETDRRMEFNSTKPRLQEFLSSSTKSNIQDIGK